MNNCLARLLAIYCFHILPSLITNCLDLLCALAPCGLDPEVLQLNFLSERVQITP